LAFSPDLHSGPQLETWQTRFLWRPRRRRTRPAVVDVEQIVSYADLATRSLAIAEVLAQTGVKPEDRVAVFLPRGAEAASAFFGTLAAGAIAIMVNESLRWRQIEHILKHSSARILLTSGDMLRRLSKPADIAMPTAGCSVTDP
jgi:acyl-CoA synthetase (AMP-forming)/AMP-acid ligase II